MNNKQLPGTNIMLSPITYGAFAIGGWFWGGADEGEAIKAIEAAIDNGVTTIDTAPVYGMGHSETVVGNTVKGKRDQVQLLTKFGMIWDAEDGDFAFDTKDNDGKPVKVYKFNGKQSVIEECERSLKRLQTDYIDLLQMHWPDSTTPIEETMEALEILIQQGKIRAAGVCNCPVDLLTRANAVLPISTNQLAYSMVNRGIEKDMVPFCMENGIGILPHTSLQKGLLTGKIKPGHIFNEGDHRPNTPYFKEHNHKEVMKVLENIQQIATDRNISLAQLTINWTMQQPAITSVLVGARDAAQMLDNVKAASFKLTPTELAIINTALLDMDLSL
ncbi:aldo/keto reductase [Pedobacter frigiditerrae]|uniref:Aldo/keto reductase n=1 Tax=Pedobacter frigiditerrae TaxID=2530452 RepID=A0A4R0MPC4_9SPHI|nr:aldo/keto reductase [Pedobacter frigiditerrae]TCC88699.1 aldo/keto reductase [Pedobacter frigiditerrae]